MFAPLPRAGKDAPLSLLEPWCDVAIDAARAHVAARELGAAASALSARTLPASFDSVASELYGLGGLFSSLPSEGEDDFSPGCRAARWAAFFAARPDWCVFSPEDGAALSCFRCEHPPLPVTFLTAS